jgi:hypothetical protein
MIYQRIKPTAHHRTDLAQTDPLSKRTNLADELILTQKS